MGPVDARRTGGGFLACGFVSGKCIKKTLLACYMPLEELFLRRPEVKPVTSQELGATSRGNMKAARCVNRRDLPGGGGLLVKPAASSQLLLMNCLNLTWAAKTKTKRGPRSNQPAPQGGRHKLIYSAR